MAALRAKLRVCWVGVAARGANGRQRRPAFNAGPAIRYNVVTFHAVPIEKGE
jgi:hypothetical protein